MARSNNCNDTCYVFLFAIFVFLCLALLVFYIVVVKVKPPHITITSLSVKSVKYDYSPSFNVSLLATVSLKNRNYGHLVLDNNIANNGTKNTTNNNNVVHVLYGNDMIVVGGSDLKFNLSRLPSRGRENVKIEINGSSSNKGVILTCEDSTMISKDLQAGKLELKVSAILKGHVYFVKNRIRRNALATMKCTIGIDMKEQSIHSWKCSNG